MKDRNGKELHEGDWIFGLGHDPKTPNQPNGQRRFLGTITHISKDGVARMDTAEYHGSWSSLFCEFATEDDRILFLLEQ
jgi:hypothetical protein